MQEPHSTLAPLWLSAVVAAFAVDCSDRPPPALYPPGWTRDGAPAASAAGGPAPTASEPTGEPYPATPTSPPPIAPPTGQGLTVDLQRYIVVDQFGYRTKMAKVAILVDPARGWNAGDEYHPGPSLEVRQWSDGKSVWRGKPSAWKGGALDESSGDRGAWLDFSSLQTKGLYYVFDPQSQARSYPFTIDDDVYRPVLKTAARMYYFNRANFEKKPPYSCVGKRCWSLGADYVGRVQDKEARSVSDRTNPKTARDLSGGWWDAGDVNKYVTFSNDPVHQLLTAYEEHPSAFTDDFGIPESGNGVPDLIDEVMVELGWLKRMQPPDLGGGALIKVGLVDYGDPVPDRSHFPRFYYPTPCSSSTIVVAGEFAHAALVLKGIARLSSEVANLTQRARDAWTFFQTKPKSDACDDGTIKSGDADRSLAEQAQDAVTAAVYLFALTGDAAFSDYVSKNYGLTHPFQSDDWSIYNPSQGDALLFYASLPNADAAAKEAIVGRKKAQLASVELYGLRPELDLYRAYLRSSMYHWGSNNQRAATGNTNYDVVRWGLARTDTLDSYRERAAGMLHSFHGVNPMQLVYLTNMYADGGDACADELFHAWFRNGDPKWDNARTSELGPAPGYVTGGPNRHYCDGQDPAQQACGASPVREQPPEKAYVDGNTGYEPQNRYDQSWELTEPGIYYQASYVRLVSKFVD
jgi:endoglucanase